MDERFTSDCHFLDTHAVGFKRRLKPDSDKRKTNLIPGIQRLSF